MRLTTAICRVCPEWKNGVCACEDHISCKECNIPRCVLLAVTHVGVKV